MPGIQPIQYIEAHGEALFHEIARHDREGIVAKRLDAPYPAGRESSWLKIKHKDYSRRGAVGLCPFADGLFGVNVRSQPPARPGK